MVNFSIERDLAFVLGDAARLMRTRADQLARQSGVTRAQWAVLFRVERAEGMKQSELADLLDLQPISLTRLIDRLCDSGLLERRSDPNDRRAKRLFLTPAARPILEQFNTLTSDLMSEALAGVDPAVIPGMTKQLSTIKENLRNAIASRGSEAEVSVERSHG
ncbi:MAG TPA: MarR family transcriptional regulator [Xanthobacteraceae bacterium]|nr:MarR family transcriptional regulator [Xanthobacteraceae bacterium]